MGRIRRLRVRNYRSIKHAVDVVFPPKLPVVLVGANNAGKSNLVRSLDLVLGESWPGNYDPEDHDYHDRDKDNTPLEIIIDVEGVSHTDRSGSRQVTKFVFRYPPDNERLLTIHFQAGGESFFVSNDTREQCLCIVIGADRRLSYQLSYASKYTFLSKLMRRFHEILTRDDTRVQQLKEEFDKVKTLFKGVPQFHTFADELQRQVGELSGNFEYQLGIDFSAYDPSNYFHALKVLPEQAGQPRTFAELGTGQEQVLAIAFAYAYAKAFHGEDKSLVLIIEEPEAHLHPLAQGWVAKRVYDLAKEDVQVLITTHSPSFVNMLNLEGLALVRKTGAESNVIQLTPLALSTHCRSKGATKATPESILPFYAAAATEEILSGFFARRIILVEGPTESLALPVYLRRIGLDTGKEGIAIIPVHGVGNLAKWWRLFTAYRIPTYVIFDNDASDDREAKRRIDLLNTLAVPGNDHTTIINAKSIVVDKAFTVFGDNFEKCMRELFGDPYERHESEAKAVFGLSLEQSKPLVARYVAEKLSIDAGSPGETALQALKQKIMELSI